MKMTRFLKYWMPVLIYAALIFISSSMSHPEIGIEVPFFDKALHLLSYSILGCLLLRALLKSDYNLSRGQLVFLAILFSTLYGISDEFHQYFVPGRTACVSDAVFDLFGSAAGAVIYNFKT